MPSWRNIGFVWRRLRRRPVFAVTAVGTASLAIGALVLALTVAETVRRWAVPLPDPERLVWIGDMNNSVEDGISFPELARWQQGNHSFVAMSVLTRHAVTYVSGSTVARIHGAIVSHNFSRSPEYLYISAGDLLDRKISRMARVLLS